MKLKHIAAAVAFTALASSSYAAGFVGFGMDAELQFKSTGGDSVKTNAFSGMEYSQNTSLSGEHEVIGALGVNYGFSLAPRWVLQVGAKADLMKTDVHNRVNGVRIGAYGATEFENLEEKSHYSVFVAPGYLIHAGTMIYAKFSYHQMKLDGSNGFTRVDVGINEAKSFGIGSSFKGFGVGVGVQTLVTKNLYAFAEVNHIRYGSEVVGAPVELAADGAWTVEPRTTSGSIGIGWRF